MKVYVIRHACVHALVDSIAARADVIIASVGVYEVRVAPQVVRGKDRASTLPIVPIGPGSAAPQSRL